MSINERLISLDVFRGLTIAGMVMVNNPGTWSAMYGPLKHAEWHGITPTDYIFPFFLFIVGVAIPIALSKRITEGPTRGVYLKIISRAAMIFALGLCISLIPFFNFNETQIPWWPKFLILLLFVAGLFFLLLRSYLVAAILIGAAITGLLISYFAGYLLVPYSFETMRIFGVLQRIAVCYLIVSLIFLHTDWKQQAIIGVAILLIYWALMTLISVPGCDITTINDKACNLAAYIDRLILTENHIWRGGKVYDPEGILSTLPAIVTTISGVLAGTWLKSKRDPSQTSNGMFFFGVILLILGWFWSLSFPLNKALWTSSYVLYTSGLALLTLAACYWIIDIKGYKKWTWPFVVFGVNALALFIFSGIMARILGMVRFAGDEGKDITLQNWIFKTFFLSMAEPLNASFAYSIFIILFWLFLMWLLYRKRIYIKV